jgi:hypothetical protein
MGFYKLRELYNLALAEGEGYGTAYEYLVKLRLLDAFARNKRIGRVLVYGLPEEYGFSLDFFYFCQKKGFEAYVFEDSKKIRMLGQVLNRVGIPKPKRANLRQRYDLLLSCEYLQKLSAKEKKEFARNVKKLAKSATVFAPNKENPSHARFSGLKGISAEELAGLFKGAGVGWIDAPFFPPGKRLGKKRGAWIVLLALQIWSYLEPFFLFKRRYAHICYVALDASA